ncbi:hypothetical protein THAOC_05794, partial [Thalassiosira oceanica]
DALRRLGRRDRRPPLGRLRPGRPRRRLRLPRLAVRPPGRHARRALDADEPEDEGVDRGGPEGGRGGRDGPPVRVVRGRVAPGAAQEVSELDDGGAEEGGRGRPAVQGAVILGICLRSVQYADS